MKKQNATTSLRPETIKKVKVLAPRRGSVCGMPAEQIETLVGTQERYERSRRVALGTLKKGFHLGGAGIASRDALHER